jgi:hypothetical protein
MSTISPWSNSKSRNLHEASSLLFLAWLNRRFSKWKRYVPPKSLLIFTGLHGVISWKMELFKVTPVYGLPFQGSIKSTGIC